MHECAFGHEPLRNRAANAAVANSDDSDTPLVFVRLVHGFTLMSYTDASVWVMVIRSAR